MPALFEMVLGGLIRHALSAVFVALAAHGYYSQDQAGQIVLGLTGAILVGLWSVWQKFSTSDATKSIIAAAEARVASAIRASSRTGVAVLVPLFLLAGFGLLATGCAAPLKQKLVLGVQASESALGVAQDTERALYLGGSASTVLTPARHQQIAADFSKAFQAEIDAATALKSYKSGDPVPLSVTTVSDMAQDVLKVVNDLAPSTAAASGTVSAFTTKVHAWIEAVVSMLKAFNVTVPPALAAALQ